MTLQWRKRKRMRLPVAGAYGTIASDGRYMVCRTAIRHRARPIELRFRAGRSGRDGLARVTPRRQWSEMLSRWPVRTTRWRSFDTPVRQARWLSGTKGSMRCRLSPGGGRVPQRLSRRDRSSARDRSGFGLGAWIRLAIPLPSSRRRTKASRGRCGYGFPPAGERRRRTEAPDVDPARQGGKEPNRNITLDIVTLLWHKTGTMRNCGSGPGTGVLSGPDARLGVVEWTGRRQLPPGRTGRCSGDARPMAGPTPAVQGFWITSPPVATCWHRARRSG